MAGVFDPFAPENYDWELAATIAAHWERNFPEQTDRLRKEGRLQKATRRAASRAVENFIKARAGGEDFDLSYLFAESAWFHPPNIDPELRR